MKTALTLAALFLASTAQAELRFGKFPVQVPWTYEALVKYTHQSDLFTGPLIPISLSGTLPYEPTNDYVAGGVTIGYKRWEFDLTHGYQSVDCSFQENGTCEWVMGTQAAVRYYFRRSSEYAVTFGNSHNMVRLEPFVTIIHLSDITKGAPFNDEKAPQNDYHGIGLTLQYRKIEIDISHGRKSLTCGGFSGCEWDSATVVDFRLYPGRRGN